MSVKNGPNTAFEAQKGKGRPKGAPNKTTTLLKDALLLAATQAGGKDGLVGYLKKQALENPQAFLPQLGKVLPLQLTGDPSAPVVFKTIYEASRDAD